MCAIIIRGMHTLNTLFEGQKNPLFMGVFFLKLLALYTVSNQERVIMG